MLLPVIRKPMVLLKDCIAISRVPSKQTKIRSGVKSFQLYFSACVLLLKRIPMPLVQNLSMKETTLRLPSDIFSTDKITITFNQTYVSFLREKMRALQSIPTSAHTESSMFVPTNLKSCSHVCLRVLATTHKIYRTS
ncbi:hypothetical protein TNCV_1537841 [Trichonephila clavipes]|nr:hypothetical protein TNCV_1537841 [Trichonephila clavipes]